MLDRAHDAYELTAENTSQQIHINSSLNNIYKNLQNPELGRILNTLAKQIVCFPALVRGLFVCLLAGLHKLLGRFSLVLSGWRKNPYTSVLHTQSILLHRNWWSFALSATILISTNTLLSGAPDGGWVEQLSLHLQSFTTTQICTQTPVNFSTEEKNWIYEYLHIHTNLKKYVNLNLSVGIRSTLCWLAAIWSSGASTTTTLAVTAAQPPTRTRTSLQTRSWACWVRNHNMLFLSCLLFWYCE